MIHPPKLFMFGPSELQSTCYISTINQMKYQLHNLLMTFILLQMSISQGGQGCIFNVVSYYGSSCSVCSWNYFLNATSNQCNACPPYLTSGIGATSVGDCKYNCSTGSRCSNCLNSTYCSSCSENYYMIVSGICNNCPVGYYTPNVNTLSSCIACQTSCSSCSNTTSCSSCPADYYLNSNNTCSSCPSGTYIWPNNVNYTCLSCPIGCQTCNGIDSAYAFNCTTCGAYTYLSFDDTYICQPCLMGQYSPPGNTLTNCLQCSLPYCLTCNSTACLTCPNGYYLNEPQCIPCVFLCQNCSNASVCLSCIFPSVWNGTSCSVTCPQATYLATNGSCQNCPIGCYSCYDDLNCYCCAANYTISSTSTCNPCQSEANCPVCPYYCQTCSQNGSCLTCLPGYLFYSYYCIQCPLFCLGCLSQNTCTVCESGYYIYEGLCYSCPASQTTFGINNQNFCCSTNCSSCLNNTSCLTCALNYYMTQGSICTACPFGLVTQSGNTNTTCSLACNNGCSSCIYAYGGCITCFEGYYLFFDNCVIDSSSNDTNNNSGSGLSQSTIIVLSIVIPVCVLVIIGIIVYCVQKKKKQSTIGTTDKPKTSDLQIGNRKYFKLTETNLDAK